MSYDNEHITDETKSDKSTVLLDEMLESNNLKN